jgi:hypothetical protein
MQVLLSGDDRQKYEASCPVLTFFTVILILKLLRAVADLSLFSVVCV